MEYFVRFHVCVWKGDILQRYGWLRFSEHSFVSCLPARVLKSSGALPITKPCYLRCIVCDRSPVTPSTDPVGNLRPRGEGGHFRGLPLLPGYPTV